MADSRVVVNMSVRVADLPQVRSAFARSAACLRRLALRSEAVDWCLGQPTGMDPEVRDAVTQAIIRDGRPTIDEQFAAAIAWQESSIAVAESAWWLGAGGVVDGA
jgi:hypothetical protein